MHTPTEVPAKTTHSYIMNIYRIDGFPVCVYYFPANLPPNSTGPSRWTAFDNSPNRNPVFPGNLNVSWVFQQLMPAFSFGNISGWIKLIRTYSPQFREGYVQMMGDAVPVSYSNGIVYVSASDMKIQEVDSKVEATRSDLGLVAEEIYISNFINRLVRENQAILNIYRKYETEHGEVDAIVETNEKIYVLEVKMRAEPKGVDVLLLKTKAILQERQDKGVIPVLTGSKINKIVRNYAKGLNVMIS